jgi:SAM-dependent methyltransferase
MSSPPAYAKAPSSVSSPADLTRASGSAASCARALTAALLRLLRPGGRLLISSFVDGFLGHEYMQTFMGWRLVCRDEAALLALVGDASGAARMAARTWLDATRCLAWLEVRRPTRALHLVPPPAD